MWLRPGSASLGRFPWLLGQRLLCRERFKGDCAKSRVKDGLLLTVLGEEVLLGLESFKNVMNAAHVPAIP